MPTQVLIRRAAAATQNARTLASGELDIDTTNKRLSVHDGTTTGGIKHATATDVQNNAFTYAAASGTNTITADYTPTPSARAAGQVWRIKAANTTTGAATFNPSSLGAGTIYKKDSGTNALVAIGANDILQDGFYDLVDIDGSTGFQLLDTRGGGITSVKQGDLSTLTGSVSAYGTVVTLPGGQYGFFPQVAGVSGSVNGMAIPAVASASYTTGVLLGSSNTAASYAALTIGGTASRVPVLGSSSDVNQGLALQRYVAACPPYDIGDGEMMGFGFLKLNAAGEIIASYMADDPPWANNGPTDIRPCRTCPMTGQEYIRQKKMPSLRDALDGAPTIYAEVALTQKIKNADMKVIPHPFGSVNDGETIVLLDPMDERVRRLMQYQNDGGDIGDFLKYVKPDNESLRRKQIKGVRQVSFKL